MSYCNLSQKIQDYASSNNVSISELERRAGLKPSTIRNIIHGRSKNPAMDTVSQIAKTFGCSVESLLGSEPTEEKNNLKKIKVDNYKLFEDILIFINKLFKQDNTTIEYEKFCNIVSEVYKYSIEHNGESLNHGFAEWLYNREK